MTPTVVVVEDEPKLRELLRGYLEREKLAVVSTASGAEALRLVKTMHPDLVLLDLGLPDIGGDEVAKEIRSISDTPILMLTARSADADRIRGFELGADDYVTKPFSLRELVLRCRAILRRSREMAAIESRQSFGDGELVIDEEQREVVVRGQTVTLTPTEWGLLLALATSPRRVYSRFDLMNRIRGYEFGGYERTVDSHVRNLRRKLERDPQSPHMVETVFGGGYRLAMTRDG